ncbi:hypothetical protein SISSUDRAFT_981708 [Sistotremastrum suecicum HHB10207 ss-3]|uniref:Mechanosensitive ion channel protein n=1 Tax=Sistotremastrum suecicum HHB10207 ss-3 TaxID=1314776 RepID=A0A166GAV2_9AGAM|nr:hypothetical protein SISSUDRAFT_981708 [Sistotremastrum suecicum HHB10207 ss-3]
MQTPKTEEHEKPTRLGHHHANSSWDVLGGIKRIGDDYSHFDSRNASNARLAFAQGDMPNNGVSKMYNWLLNVSIVTRWILFIVPVLAILWIPGILGFTATPKATIWGVHLKWWSIWFSVVWGGWWAGLALARIVPKILKYTIGVIAVETRVYIDWLKVLSRYVALVAWSLGTWISFNPLINARLDQSSPHKETVSFIAKFLFGLVLCSGILLAEKVAIQMVAKSFHERSYADRIREQKEARKILVTLYQHSSDIPDRDDTWKDATSSKANLLDPGRLLKRALKGFKDVAQTTTTAFGNVASEIAGSSVLQPNSPQAMVAAALVSANKSRLLARRLFYSFVSQGSEKLVLTDIAVVFPNAEEAIAAFALFDKDENGDVTRDEVELACLECHREQIAIASSIRDLDSAVGRLDSILMSLYTVVALLIMAVTLEAQFASVITGAGTLILGLSWLIGGSLQEVLTSIIFLFVKHPYDVGDRVKINTDDYTVKEMRLLSTIFADSNNCLVQAPHSVINTLFIRNMRRSPQMSEPFTWDVSYSTTFEQIEALRAKMLAYVKAERRDFLPNFDVVVVDIPEQSKLSLKADIKYKSNWQQGPLKVKRRNMWICALKTALAELKIFGPAGDTSAPAAPQKITMVPYEEVVAKENKPASPPKTGLQETTIPRGEWQFSDKHNVFADPAQDALEHGEEVCLFFRWLW